MPISGLIGKTPVRRSPPRSRSPASIAAPGAGRPVLRPALVAGDRIDNPGRFAAMIGGVAFFQRRDLSIRAPAWAWNASAMSSAARSSSVPMRCFSTSRTSGAGRNLRIVAPVPPMSMPSPVRRSALRIVRLRRWYASASSRAVSVQRAVISVQFSVRFGGRRGGAGGMVRSFRIGLSSNENQS